MPTKKDIDRFRGDIGENIVAYELMKRGWNVMRNVGGQGYDLLAIRDNHRVQRRVEVKTTDPKLKTGKHSKQLTVLLTESESEATDFLIFYIHGYDTFFIIPQNAFPSSRSVTVSIGKDGKISSGSQFEPYRDKWELLA